MIAETAAIYCLIYSFSCICSFLARGPRLEGYLTQLRRAETLDFASWGGFAQSYAERRIPFDTQPDARMGAGSSGEPFHPDLLLRRQRPVTCRHLR